MNGKSGSKKAIKVATLDDIHEFVRSRKSKENNSVRNLMLILVTYLFGLKLPEIIDLKIKDLFDENEVLRQKITLANNAGGIKKILPDDRLLKTLTLCGELLFCKRDTNFDSNNHLFITQKRKPFTLNSLQRAISFILKNAGLEGYTSKSLWMGHAVFLYNQGESIDNITSSLGYTNKYRLLRELKLHKKAKAPAP